MTMTRPLASCLVFALCAAACTATGDGHAGAGSAPTLDAVRSRRFVRCGVSTGIAGFSSIDRQGEWHGLDVDVCRAIAAAVLGDATRVR
jgi:general L-amino acid transport system substrate-binding protein